MSSEDEKMPASKGAFQYMESADSIIKIWSQNIQLNGDSICYIILVVVCDGGFSTINRFKTQRNVFYQHDKQCFILFLLYLFIPYMHI
jgi:hypothetical protein